MAGPGLDRGLRHPFETTGLTLQVPVRKFSGVKVREYWPPNDVAGELGLETQPKEARDVLGLTV